MFFSSKNIKFLFLLYGALLLLTGCFSNSSSNNTYAKEVSVDELLQNAILLYGKEDAKVKVVIFSDYLCPYCKKLAEENYDFFKNTEGIAVYHRDLVVHTKSLPLSLAVRCAGEYGKANEMHSIVFANVNAGDNLQRYSEDLIEAKAREYAMFLGINPNAFSDCIKQKKYFSSVEWSTNNGYAMGLKGTPSIFVNKRLIAGYVKSDELKKIINEELSSVN